MYQPTNTEKDVDLYIELYKRIFVFDTTTPKQNTQPIKIIPIIPTLTPKPKDYYYVNLNQLNIPSIYIKVFDHDGIHANGLNLGDGYSYVDFKKHIISGLITFYRRNPANNKLLELEYDPAKDNLAAIVNKQRYPIGEIIEELHYVLRQISAMKNP